MKIEHRTARALESLKIELWPTTAAATATTTVLTTQTIGNTSNSICSGEQSLLTVRHNVCSWNLHQASMPWNTRGISVPAFSSSLAASLASIHEPCWKTWCQLLDFIQTAIVTEDFRQPSFSIVALAFKTAKISGSQNFRQPKLQAAKTPDTDRSRRRPSLKS